LIEVWQARVADVGFGLTQVGSQAPWVVPKQMQQVVQQKQVAHWA
jgi:hypothetical protein